MKIPSPAEQIASLEARLAEALKFLSHDVREGHSSTLALLELQRIKSDPMSLAELSERIESNARKSLAAIDDFGELARARTRALVLEEVDLVDMMVELVADAWWSASQAGISIRVADHPEVLMVRADRELLNAALGRLMREGVETASRGSSLTCGLRQAPNGECVFELTVPSRPEAQAEPEVERGGASPPGARRGIGWRLAEAVAERHAARLHIAADTDGRQVLSFQLPAKNQVIPE